MESIKLWIRPFLLLLTVLSLSSCVNLKAPKASTNFDVMAPAARAKALRQYTRWEAVGALSLQHGSQLVVLSFHWNQATRNQYRIQMASAGGLYNMSLVSNIGHVTLWRTETKHASASTPEKLMQRELGWSIPVRNLYYWIRNLPGPGQSKRTYDRWGHLVELRQQGWLIDYKGFRHYSSGVDLPTTLYLTRRDFRIKIVIQRWVSLTRSVGDLEKYSGPRLKGS